MNPAYGRAVERARDAEATSEQVSGEHWVTVNGRHILIQKAGSTRGARHEGQQQPEYEAPDVKKEKEVELTNVTYNETSGLRADPKAKPGAPGSAEDLHNARVAVAEVAHTVLDSDHPERVKAPTDLTARAVHDINAGNSDAISAHNDSLSAVREVLAGSNATKGATQYRMNARDTQKSINGKRVTLRYGPFSNVQGGTRVIIIAH
jgi:hypothetical protein